MSAMGRRAAVAAVAAVTALALLRAGEPASAGRYRQWVRVVAPGVTLRRIYDAHGPRRIFVLTADLAQGYTLDTALAQDTLAGYERPSSMAARHGALAAVNGDFGSPSGRPAHAFAEDGDLKQTSPQLGAALAVAADGTPSLGRPALSVAAVEADTGETWGVDGWNRGPVGVGEIVGFTPAGGDLEPPPPYACSVRLGPTSGLESGEQGVTRAYAVEASACQAEPMPVAGGVVLSAEPATDEAVLLASLAPGEAVRVTWTAGWPRTLDLLGGAPLLVEDGQVVLGACTTSLCHRHPRTAVGLTADGRVLLVVVDGRQPRYSVGMTLAELARLMVSLGARWAMNLDGGGSSVMVVQGEVVNRPSDGAERAVSSALLLLAGPDPGQAGVGSLRPPSGAGSPGRLALTDPGSTAGLREAQQAGEVR